MSRFAYLLPTKQNMRHGKAHSKIYWIWHAMHQRCGNLNNIAYKNYGGRGITVCKRWMKFKNFFADMGERPDDMSLDRIDNNKGYSPENCRWATRQIQRLNQRNPQISNQVLKKYTGIVMDRKKGASLQEIADKYGYATRQAIHRICRDWGHVDKSIACV